MTRFLPHVVFVAGLAVIGWVGAGYLAGHALALAVTLLIAVFYVVGALELRRFQQATATLTQAVAGLAGAPAHLADWLASLHPSLRDAVRARVEGGRGGLPGPVLAPYLVGLLVLLGMLGTFLGMVVTLRGTGVALERATDLDAIRASLSAPVMGLGLAFGTSVAGVAASAMLGLLSAMARRERLLAAEQLDARIAGALRPFSLAHQRELSFQLLQRQADAMPVLVDRLQAMMQAMERQSQALGERLSASQERFHEKVEAGYAGLAASVDQSLKQSLTDSARIAGATIQPVVEATMAGIARETTALHGQISQTVQQQLDGVSARFAASTTEVADTWKAALAEQQRSGETQSRDLRDALAQFTGTFEERAAALVDNVTARLAHTAGSVGDSWGQALAQHQQASQQMAGETQQALSTATAGFAQHVAALRDTVGEAHARLQQDIAARDEARLAAWTGALGEMASALRQEWQQAGASTAQQQQAICDTLAQTARDMSAQTEAHARDTIAEIARLVQTAGEAPRAAAEVIAELRQKLAESTERDNALLQERGALLQQLHTDLAARDEARLAAWAASLGAITAALREQWQQAGAQAQAQTEHTIAEVTQLVQTAAEAPRAAAEVIAELRQKQTEGIARDNALLQERGALLQQLHADLAARDEARLASWTESLGAMATALREQWQQAGAQAQAQTEHTIAEVTQLVQTAAEAPRAAAEVIAELRQKLSDGMARDNAMLEERSRILETLGTLLDAVNHASSEQRAAIDALVTGSAELLERVGSRFGEQVGTQGEQMTSAAAQLTGSAVEVASLGEAFGAAVQRFDESGEKLIGQLQRIEGALAQSLTRSDEQLAYYVAQAREVIDLSIMSQKQVVDDLQRLGARAAPAIEGSAA